MRNKKLIYIIILFSFLMIFLLAFIYQQKQKIKLIGYIQEKIQLIDNEKDYETKKLTNEYFFSHGQITDGGEELTGYFKNRQPSKIKESVGLSSCVKNFDYYFLNNVLIYVYETEQDFPETDNGEGLNYEKLDLVFEGRYYFDNGKLFYTKNNGSLIRCSDDFSKLSIEQLLLTKSKYNTELLSK